MLWVKSKWTKLAVGGLLAATAAVPALAQNVVVRSQGPSAGSYPAGKKLAGNATLQLQKLDKVTVFTPTGTRVFNGPGNYSLARRASNDRSASTRLQSFVTSKSVRTGRPTAVRGAGATADPLPADNIPSPWYLDVRKGGKFCVTSPDRLVMWRPDFTGSATAQVIEPTSGQIKELQWDPGRPLKAWPRAEAPVTDGATYRVQGSNLAQQVDITFKLIADPGEDAAAVAAALADNGCLGQLDHFAADSFVEETAGTDTTEAADNS